MNAAFEHAAAIAPGHGHLDLSGFATLDRIGAGLEMETKLKSNLTAFARAEAGLVRGQGFKPDASVIGGLRWQW
jgi:hypothetical protein